MQFSEEDQKYVVSCIAQGTSLDQAVAQLEVLKEEKLFKDNLIAALSDKFVMRKIHEIAHMGYNL